MAVILGSALEVWAVMIEEHGGEAASSRAAFLDLSTDAQMDLITFLNNLVLFKTEEEE